MAVRSAPEARVRSLAKRWGCTLDTSDGEVNIEAPKGKNWAADPGVHELVNSPFGEETQRDMWSEALRRMEVGLMECVYGEACEWCHGPEANSEAADRPKEKP